MLGLVRFFVCYYLTCLLNVYGADKSSCHLVGFTSQLKCGSCNELKRFKLDKIEKDCFECCETEDAHRVIKVSASFHFSRFFRNIQRPTWLYVPDLWTDIPRFLHLSVRKSAKN
ncbi:hypothetical protein PHET_04103 [Paragonimus heterotremus]|uniref:Selenoprotein F/M domain-containing protein n=1 Tax=Paragonimus heterotremus TaxID=100268 RepID=A0A8J4TM84_9TREM|nr:hypothetical protein PHET_04103 [Paragonimus heterotremus]